MSIIIDIADAVVTELNGHGFSPPFVAARLYRPVFDLAEMSALHVSVVPRGVAIERADRTQKQVDVQIDIAVQKKFEAGDAAELDPLMALVEAIADFFQFRRLTAYPGAVWTKTENVPVYAPEHMEQFRQFTSVLTLTFRVLR
jgi:hypothetical protein